MMTRSLKLAILLPITNVRSRLWEHCYKKLAIFWAVVVAQLVERLLLTPEIHGSNPLIGKFYFPSAVLKTVLKRRK